MACHSQHAANHSVHLTSHPVHLKAGRRPVQRVEAVHVLTDSEADTDDEGVDANKPYIFHEEYHGETSQCGFKSLYESGQLFDVTLTVDKKEFLCHKAFLAAWSEYFRCLFTTSLAEHNQSNITINGVDATSMQLVLNYLYTGKVELNSETVQSLLSAANLFQLRGLRNGCADYMQKKIEVDNCIGIHFFAQAHECRELELQAWNVIIENFEAVSENPEFLEMSVESLLEVIKYDDIQAIEEDVFESVVRWFQHKPDERNMHIQLVVQFIRFWLMDEHYLYDRVKTCSMLVADPRVLSLLDEVVHYKLLRNRWMETDLYMEPRYGADFCR